MPKKKDQIVIVSSRRKLFADDKEHNCYLCNVNCYTSAKNHYSKDATFVCIECVQEKGITKDDKITVTEETVKEVEKVMGIKTTKEELIKLAEKEILERKRYYFAS